MLEVFFSFTYSQNFKKDINAWVLGVNGQTEANLTLPETTKTLPLKSSNSDQNRFIRM